MVTTYEIWKAQERCVFESNTWYPSQICMHVALLLEEFQWVNDKPNQYDNQPPQRWSQPPQDHLKVNIDVIVSIIDARFGFGCVIRDVDRDVFGAMVDNMGALFNQLVVVPYVMWHGLEFSIEAG